MNWIWIQILALTVALAISFLITSWLAMEQRRLIVQLKRRIRTLEQLAGLDAFPPLHPMCRCTTFTDRGLSEPNVPVIKRGGRP